MSYTLKFSLFVIGMFLGVTPLLAQQKNFLDKPYLETRARVDTTVTPDRIYLGILLSEEDSKGRNSLEAQEQKMGKRLSDMGIDLKKQLSVANLSSDFQRYFLRGKEVLKTKSFQLLVYDAPTAGQAMYQLEQIGIANVRLLRTDYSKMESLKLDLRKKAVSQAREQAGAMVSSLGQRVGNALYISDVSSPFIYRMEAPTAMMRTMAADTEMAPQLNVDFQKIKVEIQVNVNFALLQE